MAFEVAQVVGTGNVQELLCQTIDLGCHVEEIKEIRKTVIVDNCRVVFDKVIIDGRLRKDIMFKQANHGFPVPGTVAGCTGITSKVTGPILDVDVEIAFNALVPVPGAKPGDKCVVLQAFVEGEKEEPANIECSGAFTHLVDKSIIFLCVKVVRDVVTNNLMGGGVTTGTVINGAMMCGGATGTNCQDQNMVCPPRRSTGFSPSGFIGPAQPGLLPGTWVGPTLIFEGVLNPGIPTAIPTKNMVTHGGSLIQVTGMQPTTGVSDITTTGGTVIS